MQKHRYEIKINNGSLRGETFIYKYGNTKDILLRFSKFHVTAIFELTILKRPDDFSGLKVNLFRDVMRKVYLLHTLLFAQSLTIRSICISIDGQDTIFDNKQLHFPFVISMLGTRSLELGELRRHSGVIQTLLSATKSSSEWDERQCALYSYLLGKTRSFETDRFLNYWTAMNAYLNVFAKEYEIAESNKLHCSRKELPSAKKMYKIDNACIGSLISVLQPGACFPKKPDDLPEFRSAYHAIDQELFNNDNLEVLDLYQAAETDLFFQKRDNTYKAYFDIADRIHLSLYVFLLLVYPYWLRCNYFHGSKTAPIIASFIDPEIKDLNVVNCFLDRFLSMNIPRLYEGNIVSDDQIALIEVFLKNRNK